MSDWSALALERLREAGHRRGSAQTVVVEHLGAHGRCGATARDLAADLQAAGRPVGRATVYRVLEQLDALRLVTRLDIGDGVARYEPNDPAGHHHHHLVCDRCGSVTPFEDPALERSIAALSERVAFTVAEHDVVLRGACGDCG